MRSDPKYAKFKEDLELSIKKIPNIGPSVARTLERVKNGIKQMVVPGMLFEDMGIKYLGPVDGHNITELTRMFYAAKALKGPVIIHVITQKGKGYEFAEKRPDKFHGIGPFDCDSGEINSSSSSTSYSKAFGDSLIKIAEKNKNIVALTAAMRDGTGLKEYSEIFPERFFDVGIAEQHAVTLAAGMAKEGLRPVFAVYSTFLQRAYDQILHDVCIQKLPVVFAIDRAGLVGEDGETHQGIFDLSFLSHIPNMVIAAPKCTDEMDAIFAWALVQDNPVAIRYPRGGDSDRICMPPVNEFELGKWEMMNSEGNVAIIATGRMVQTAVEARDLLSASGIKAKLINGCFIKPVDKDMLKKIAEDNIDIVTLEDNVISGGFGMGILEEVNRLNSSIRVLNLGFKDSFIPHGNINLLFKNYGLDAAGVKQSIENFINMKE